MARQDGVDRRRVIQGALWSAPVILIATAAPASAVASPEPKPQGQIIVRYQAARFQSDYYVNGVGSISAIDFNIYGQLADQYGGGGDVASLTEVELKIVFPDDFGGTTPRWGFYNNLGVGAQPWIFVSDVFDTVNRTTTVIFNFKNVPLGPAGQMLLQGLFIETTAAAVGTQATFTFTGTDTEGRILITPGGVEAKTVLDPPPPPYDEW